MTKSHVVSSNIPKHPKSEKKTEWAIVIASAPGRIAYNTSITNEQKTKGDPMVNPCPDV